MEPGTRDFDGFCSEVERCMERHADPLKSERYGDADILKVFGDGASALHRARHGLEDIEEMAYTVAEHHPYWRMLNAISEMARIVLDRWEDTSPDDDMDQLAWEVAGMKDALDRLSSPKDNPDA